LTHRLQEIASHRRHRVGFLLSIDQEGGVVARLTKGATVLPGNMALGAIGSEEWASRASEVTADEMMALGFNMNLAPVLDINNNPDNPGIGVRSFGEDVSPGHPARSCVDRGLPEPGSGGNRKTLPGEGRCNRRFPPRSAYGSAFPRTSGECGVCPVRRKPYVQGSGQ